MHCANRLSWNIGIASRLLKSAALSAYWDYPHVDANSVVKDIVVAAGIRTELSFTSFRHGGFTEGADSDLTDAELRAAGRHRSARQLPTYAKRTRKQLVSVATKRRSERTKG